MSEVLEKAQKADQVSRVLAHLSESKKNQVLLEMAKRLREGEEALLEANQKDLLGAEKENRPSAFMDRLRLNKRRIEAMAEGLEQIAALPDPIGEILEGFQRPNGLRIEKIRVPLGVIGIIYESRPNVTVDAAGLCFKSGNAVLLRGGSEAIHSNKALTQILQGSLENFNLPREIIQLVESTDRAAVGEMLKLNKHLDVIIPRGGGGLIQFVVQNSTVPVLETGEGNCHVYVDESADLAMAAEIVINAKCQRPGVCNAAEKLLIHRSLKESFLPQILKKLKENKIRIKGTDELRKIDSSVELATEEDWHIEFLDLVMGVKLVGSMEEAMEHISKYGSSHSESIITTNYDQAETFLRSVDSAAVYVNASTRFTDGYEFGFGAEIGISTQRLHARGPMGLKELTTYKYIVRGNGQIRM